MPTYLRNFYYKRLAKAKETEQKEIKKRNDAQKRITPRANPKINPRFKR